MAEDLTSQDLLAEVAEEMDLESYEAQQVAEGMMYDLLILAEHAPDQLRALVDEGVVIIPPISQ